MSGLGALLALRPSSVPAVTWSARISRRAFRSGSPLVESCGCVARYKKHTHLSIYSSVLTQSSTHERGGAAPSPTLNFLILYCTHTLFLFVVRLANKHCSVLVVKINSKTEQMPRDLPASGPNHHPQAIFCNCSELQELATTIAQPRIRTFLPFSARQPVSFCHCSTQHVVSDLPPGLAVNMTRSMIGSSFPS